MNNNDDEQKTTRIRISDPFQTGEKNIIYV